MCKFVPRQNTHPRLNNKHVEKENNVKDRETFIDVYVSRGAVEEAYHGFGK